MEGRGQAGQTTQRKEGTLVSRDCCTFVNMAALALLLSSRDVICAGGEVTMHTKTKGVVRMGSVEDMDKFRGGGKITPKSFPFFGEV